MHLEMPVRVTAAKLASPSSRPDRRETFPSPQKVKPVSRIIAFSDASHPPCRLNFLPWNPVGLPWKDKNQPWNVVGLPWSLVFQPCRDVFLSGGAVRLPCGHVCHGVLFLCQGVLNSYHETLFFCHGRLFSITY